MNYLFSLLLILSLTDSKADLNQVAEALNQIKTNNEAAVNELNSEQTQLQERISSLQRQLQMAQSRLTTINSQTESPELQPTIIKLTSAQVLELLNQKTFGPCQVKLGKNNGEYIVTNSRNETSLRFFFAPENSALAPTAELKMVGLQNNEPVIELNQPLFTPSGVEPRSQMRVIVRFNSTTLEPVFATFRGHTIYRYPLGLYTSYTPDQLSCIL